ncbi:MAG: MBL fold metallo-hydrolase [Candidatus Eremiobacteraeota bacterium]|nr:MBL fold metallo-hydrolase [Candidatus Eremiobacteraeota bacterium]
MSEPPAEDRLRLTVAGSSNAVARPGRACSSYFVEAAGTKVVLDLGSGAVGNLRRHTSMDGPDAIIISHMHPDHFLDLVPLRYGLRYGARTTNRRPVLYLPPDGEALLRRVVDPFATDDNGHFLDVYELREYDPEGTLTVGDITVRFALSKHYIPAFAMRAEYNGSSVTYSADTAPEQRVVDLAKDTGLFICEATLRPHQRDAEPRGHSTAREAGEMAQHADARRLLLSHYGSEALRDELESEARSTYQGDLLVADDHMSITL